MLGENIAERQNEVHNTYINYGIPAAVAIMLKEGMGGSAIRICQSICQSR